jgi:hypothetical protein
MRLVTRQDGFAQDAVERARYLAAPFNFQQFAALYYRKVVDERRVNSCTEFRIAIAANAKC